jgi:hypothetical protein
MGRFKRVISAREMTLLLFSRRGCKMTMEKMTAGAKMRVDLLLVERGLVPSRERARALILAGPGSGERTEGGEGRRGGSRRRSHPPAGRGPALCEPRRLKLAAALAHWPIAVQGRACLDVGASTGGIYRLPAAARRGARHRRRYRLWPDRHEAAQRPARPPGGAHQCAVSCSRALAEGQGFPNSRCW